MGQIVDIGVRSRPGVVAPIRILLDFLRAKGSGEQTRLILADAQVLGIYNQFPGSIEDLLRDFSTSDTLGFLIGFGCGTLASVYPPRSFSSAPTIWRIIAETRERWEASILDQIIILPEIDYAALTQDDTLDMDNFENVEDGNFPWGDWRLIAARLPARAANLP